MFSPVTRLKSAFSSPKLDRAKSLLRKSDATRDFMKLCPYSGSDDGTGLHRNNSLDACDNFEIWRRRAQERPAASLTAAHTYEETGQVRGQCRKCKAEEDFEFRVKRIRCAA